MEWDSTIDRFIQHQRAAGRPETTNRLRFFHLRHLAKHLGQPPPETTTEDLLAYLADLEVTSNTKRAIRTSIRAFFSWATLADVTDHDPSTSLPTISSRPGRPRPASDEAIYAALEHASPRVKLMIRLGAWQGLRCREIARVNTKDVNRDGAGWSLTIHGKGDRERIIPLRDDIARELRRAPGGYVFPGQNDGHLSPQYVSRLVSKALPSGVTAHMLRHRFASTAYSSTGHDIRAVQTLLGHASVATTQVYTATSMKSLRKAIRTGRRALLRFRFTAWMHDGPRELLEWISARVAPRAPMRT